MFLGRTPESVYGGVVELEMRPESVDAANVGGDVVRFDPEDRHTGTFGVVEHLAEQGALPGPRRADQQEDGPVVEVIPLCRRR